jgi:hypothetical protein
MKLSDDQVAALRQALQLRYTDPSIIRSFFAGLKAHAAQSFVVSAIAAYLWWDGFIAGSMLALSVLLGAILRDLEWHSMTKKMWPLNREITDWRRVEELLAENTPRGPEPNKTIEPTR